MSGFVIGFCPVISDNEDGVRLFHWLVTERESSQFSCLASAKLAAASSEPASSPVCASPQPRPCVFSAVLLLRISPALVSTPIERFLSPAFLFSRAPASGFTIGLCPINSENNDSSCLFDWMVPECGSSKFRRAA